MRSRVTVAVSTKAKPKTPPETVETQAPAKAKKVTDKGTASSTEKEETT